MMAILNEGIVLPIGDIIFYLIRVELNKIHETKKGREKFSGSSDIDHNKTN
jgi:hypothetical protein